MGQPGSITLNESAPSWNLINIYQNNTRTIIEFVSMNTYSAIVFVLFWQFFIDSNLLRRACSLGLTINKLQ